MKSSPRGNQSRRRAAAAALGVCIAALAAATPVSACVWSPNFERDSRTRIALLRSDESEAAPERREALRETLAHELRMLATLQEQAARYPDAQRSLEELVEVHKRRTGARARRDLAAAQATLARVLARQGKPAGRPGPTLAAQTPARGCGAGR